MNIRCRCPQCAHRFDVPSHYRERPVKCPECQGGFPSGKAIATRRLPVKSFTAFVITSAICVPFVLWTNRQYPSSPKTPEQRQREHLEQKLEQQRERNYLENIKPHIPSR